jgi:hypothetical protein
MSCHNYEQLIRRWRAVARAAGLRLQVIANVDGFSVYCIRTSALYGQGGIYVSAGIHGDEPASCAGLILWAERQCKELRRLPMMIFPCLNPWGLVGNLRKDAEGNDVNRMFHLETHPTVAGILRVCEGIDFTSGILLHEDYDAQGIYLYEHSKGRACGEGILEAASAFIARDSRMNIDGRRARRGLLRPRLRIEYFDGIGHPEAIWLHRRGSKRTITFETPSEAALQTRCEAHVSAISTLVREHMRVQG